MGKCKYCGLSAGFLGIAHRECEERCERAKQSIVDLVGRTVANPQAAGQMRAELQTSARIGRVGDEEARQTVLDAWSAALDECLADGILSQDEEARLVLSSRVFGITRDEMEKLGVRRKVAMGRALRNILIDGRLPDHRPGLPPSVALNFQKGEELVWVFEDVPYAQEVSRREYVGGSSGFSFRVAKGVYYRVGGVRGHSVAVNETQIVDQGTVAFTTKHVYFAGCRKNFRVPYSKIVAFQPHVDGITFTRDTATAKPQTFLIPEGWFVYNLAMSLAGTAS